jgi:hypothetical protein
MGQFSVPQGMPLMLVIIYALLMVTLGVITVQFSGSVII